MPSPIYLASINQLYPPVKSQTRPLLSTMRPFIVVLATLATSVYAFPSKSNASPDSGTICAAVGKSCPKNDAPLCCKAVDGFAFCHNGKVKLTACGDRSGCGAIAGKIQCIADPSN